MRQTIRALRIARWEEYQHYQTGRNPPWIKLHSRLLDDHEFSLLSPMAQLLGIKLMLAASRSDNHLPADCGWIGRQTAMLDPCAPVRELIEAGYLEPCGCDHCSELPEPDLLAASASVSLASHARARLLSSPSVSSISGEEGDGGRRVDEVEPMPEPLASESVAGMLGDLLPERAAGIKTLGDLWGARVRNPAFRKPIARSLQRAQINAFRRGVETFGLQPMIGLVVQAVASDWREFTDELIRDRLGGGKTATKSDRQRTEATAGIDPRKRRSP